MPFADELIGAGVVKALARALAVAAPDRRWPSVRRSAAQLAPLGLSERARAIRDALLADGPADYREFATLIRRALEQEEFTGWMIWPVTEAIAALATVSFEDAMSPHSGGPAMFEDGLALLAELTPRLTSEFAIRTFLVADLDRTLAVVRGWPADPDPHVRRLASEGTRLRLPWARRVPALTARPEATIPVLDQLYTDDSEYVRRSVANHLNDLSRLDGDLAVQTAARWSAASAAPETARLVRHALRTLIKQGHPGALALLGFAPPTGLLISGPELAVATVRLGGELSFTVDVSNPGPESQRIAVDYVVHYRKANASLAPKVFKLTVKELAPGERLSLARRVSFAPISTRRYYPGEHALEVQVNGAASGRVPFELVG